MNEKDASIGPFFNMPPYTQIEVACRAYHQEMVDDDGEEPDPNSEESGVSPKVVGHNIYILCHQVRAWPVKSCQMSIKVAQKLFNKKMTPLRKMPKNVGNLGKINVDKGFEKFPKLQ